MKEGKLGKAEIELRLEEIQEDIRQLQGEEDEINTAIHLAQRGIRRFDISRLESDLEEIYGEIKKLEKEKWERQWELKEVEVEEGEIIEELVREEAS